MAGVEIEQAWVGVTGQHLACLNSRGEIQLARANREITWSDVERGDGCLRQRGLDPPTDRSIHAISRGFAVDDEPRVKNPVGLSANKLAVETHVVTASRNLIDNVVRCVEAAGLGVAELVAEPLATADAILSEDEQELGVLLVDIGGGTTDIALFSEGSVSYTGAESPAAGNNVTHDLAIALGITHPQAEQIKLAHGCARTSEVPEEQMVALPRDEEERTISRRFIAEVIEAARPRDLPTRRARRGESRRAMAAARRRGHHRRRAASCPGSPRFHRTRSAAGAPGPARRVAPARSTCWRAPRSPPASASSTTDTERPSRGEWSRGRPCGSSPCWGGSSPGHGSCSARKGSPALTSRLSRPATPRGSSSPAAARVDMSTRRSPSRPPLQASAPQCSLLYIGGDRMEAKLVPEAGLGFRQSRCMALRGTCPLETAASGARRLADRRPSSPKPSSILRRFRPDVVIGTGGYVSGQVLLAALG